MSHAVLAHLRETLAERFGKNKTEELCRLIYEIARREENEPLNILTLALEGSALEQIRFTTLKQTLLKRRFPNLAPEDLKRTYLAPLHLPSESEQIPSMRELFKPTAIFIEKRAKHYPLAGRVMNAWPEVEMVEIEAIDELRRPKKDWMKDFGKRTLAISVEPFDLVKPCPCSTSTVSCNYYLLNIGYGCPYDCTYCYLQAYQNLPAIVLPANLEEFLAHMDQKLELKPGQFTRIGTGEYADSLALDWLTEYSKILVPHFKDKAVTLELKTKSDCIENLLNLDHGGRTVIAWSVNPERFCNEEKKTAAVQERLRAAKRCEEAGYGTAFHFDPLILAEGCEKDYERLVEMLFDHVNESIRWISLGALRFHKDLRRAAEYRHPESQIFLGEGRLDPLDEKMRYTADSRIRLYREMVRQIQRYRQNTPIYLCMESPEVWRSVFEGKPYQGKIDQWIACGSS
ncbi:MAG: hypothetical protein COV74_09910 [Candidatus Omnitrophica bacterium CG11_big_fil_rev_8_21_14_0_20_45_26]|uniref:Elp3/MiaA/NifB-like radical SAM core domain-containing protein n=1 Tax=Candidatus Abzuiibacterium crystallinum TaxID=1974748 RepID=A0A2H0LLH5_9BACT|nr:MAG: hypothetical protein COV74_09910 [Candidatus Omnitrophica bacterium CG11_big_fil_rev_8_21_14_0_20_45_26]PIW64521.1 MAG: hypothetical protein COW12_06035 [Candidatus Omnitrophica bacterium CG12_big_fil_rev_8_21_14_0_65_45_16]